MLTYLGRRRGLILWGGTRLGKTVWARSLGSHIYCIGLVSGDECVKVKDAEYAVFDDIRGGIKFFPSFKEWLGSQMYVTVKKLYREPMLLPWGKPCIWLANSDPRDEMSQVDAQWLEGNCDFVELTSAIFHASTE